MWFTTHFNVTASKMEGKKGREKTSGLMVNFSSNVMWLIRQAIPPGILEKRTRTGPRIRKRDG